MSFFGFLVFPCFLSFIEQNVASFLFLHCYFCFPVIADFTCSVILGHFCSHFGKLLAIPTVGAEEWLVRTKQCPYVLVFDLCYFMLHENISEIC